MKKLPATLAILTGLMSQGVVSAQPLYIKVDATGGDCQPVVNPIGNWSAATKTCTLTAPVNDSIQILDNGLTLDCAGHALTGSGYGVRLNGNSVTVKNCVISNHQIAIVSTGNSNTITKNTLTGNRGMSIYGFDASRNTITDNTLSSVGFYNLLLVYGYENNVIGNTFSGAANGITLRRSNDNFVADNAVSDYTFFGIEIDFAFLNTVTGNNLRRTHTPPPGGFGGGVFLWQSNDNLIDLNDIDVTDSGILIENNSDRNIVSANRITATDLGVAVGSRPRPENSYNLIFNNVIDSEGDGVYLHLGEGNRAEGNTIQHGTGNGIVVNASRDAELVRNEVHKKGGNGLMILSSPTTLVTLNDVWLNSGVPVSSDTPVELSVDALVTGGTAIADEDCSLKALIAMRQM